MKFSLYTGSIKDQYFRGIRLRICRKKNQKYFKN